MKNDERESKIHAKSSNFDNLTATRFSLVYWMKGNLWTKKKEDTIDHLILVEKKLSQFFKSKILNSFFIKERKKNK